MEHLAIEDVENFFKKHKKIPKVVKLNNWTTITDTKLFIETHLSYIKTYGNVPLMIPYKKRILELINYLKNAE
jgi:hypothetical protein